MHTGIRTSRCDVKRSITLAQRTKSKCGALFYSISLPVAESASVDSELMPSSLYSTIWLDFLDTASGHSVEISRNGIGIKHL